MNSFKYGYSILYLEEVIMENILKKGDSVIIVFNEGSRYISYYIKGIITEIDDQLLCEVVGEDNKTYSGYYGQNQANGIVIYTREDYVEYLRKKKEKNDNDIFLLKKKNEALSIEIFDVNSEIRLELKKKEMLQCNHLFVKLRDSEVYGGFHSSDYEYEPSIIKCVHCGLTNYYMSSGERDYRKYYPKYKLDYVEMNDQVYKMQASKGFKRGSLISEEVLNSKHSECLYAMALKIKPKGKKKEIFDIMKTLYELETPEEKWSWGSPKDEDLIERYQNEKTLKIKK